VKDPDSSSGKTDSADDMSLADLLGGAASSTEPEAPRRVEHRSDEPDSGMVNLARMVAQSSIDIAKSPSLIPPPAEPQAPAQPAVGDPSGVFPTQTGAQFAAPVQKKNNSALIAVVAIAVIAAGAVAFIALNKEAPKQDDSAAIQAANQAAKMMAEMQAKAEADRKAAEEKEAMLLAKLEAMAKTASAGGTGAVSAEDQAKMEAVKEELAKATAQKEEAAQKASGKDDSEHKSSHANKPRKDDGAGSPKAETTPTGGGSSKEDKADKTVATTPKTGADEVDALLGGSKPKGDDKKTPSAASDDTPKQPSRDQVNTAMAPIKAKAQASCAKYSTGTVQVQVVVSNEGKVKSATPTGVFANNPAGTCVAMMARGAKFPKFKDPTFTFSYPITLQ
jgi:hypothetical protein